MCFHCWKYSPLIRTNNDERCVFGALPHSKILYVLFSLNCRLPNMCWITSIWNRRCRYNVLNSRNDQKILQVFGPVLMITSNKSLQQLFYCPVVKNLWESFFATVFPIWLYKTANSTSHIITSFTHHMDRSSMTLFSPQHVSFNQFQIFRLGRLYLDCAHETHS